MAKLPPLGAPLSRREHQLIQLLVEGLEFKQVAHRLSISPNTVAMHSARAQAKLGLKNLVQLGVWAQKAGYTLTSAPVLHSDRCSCREDCDGLSCVV